MFHVVLYQPEIPPNTGNIIRLCANSGAHLHIIQPAGFSMDDAQLRRAHLDYRDLAHVHLHSSMAELRAAWPLQRMFAMTTHGDTAYHEVNYVPGDAFLFGPETRGLPEALLAEFPAPDRIRIPMLPHSRSLNLSNAVAILLYEAWRQRGFAGGG